MAFNPPNIKGSGTYLTTGVKLEKGANPGVRQELRTLHKDEELWHLFMMGLWALQRVPQYRDLSYYQLAGIHGKPYVAWPPNDTVIQAAFKRDLGFCTHSSILFLPWHRPYLALYEQMIYEAIKYVVDQFDDGTEDEGADEYRQRAPEFRLPFWDWARDKLHTIPGEVVEDKIRVPMPMKMRKEYGIKSIMPTVEIDNPLFGYEFGHHTAPEVLLLGSRNTERYGKVQKDQKLAREGTTAEQRHANMQKYMTPWTSEASSNIKPEGNLAERLVYLLQAYSDFGMVSHNKFDPSRVPKQPDAMFKASDINPTVMGEGYGSIEDIHNVIHGLVGGTGEYDGHMAQVEVAAFDPLFWLHHCNIDRIFAIWEALHYDPANPKTYVIDREAGEANFTRDIGEMEGMKTPLMPFYKTSTEFWTAEDVRDTANLGYVYPETKKWEHEGDEAKYRASIMEALNKSYSNASLANIMSNCKYGVPAGKKSQEILKHRALNLLQIQTSKAPDSVATAQAMKLNPDPKVTIPQERELLALASDDTYWEYMFNITAQKHALDGRYGIHVFIGPVEEEDTAKWILSPNHVGTFKPLGQPADTMCAKCQVDQVGQEQVSSQIPLTIALVERYLAGIIDDTEPATVTEHLKEFLHWEVVQPDGTRLKNKRNLVDGLKVSVSCNEVKLPAKKYGMPEYSPNVQYLPEITTDAEGNGRAEGTGVTMEDILKRISWMSETLQSTGS